MKNILLNENYLSFEREVLQALLIIIKTFYSTKFN
jgi:hypothetical protein